MVCLKVLGFAPFLQKTSPRFRTLYPEDARSDPGAEAEPRRRPSERAAKAKAAGKRKAKAKAKSGAKEEPRSPAPKRARR